MRKKHQRSSKRVRPAAFSKANRRSKSDSNARRRTEKALLDANQRLRSVLIANEVGTWTWDIPNDVLIADENLARLFGVSRKDAAGAPIQKYFEAIHPGDRDRVRAAVEKVLQGPDERYAVDYRVVRNGGAISWVTARGKVERDETGKAKYFPGVVLDITERKNSEQEAAGLNRRLEQQSVVFDTTLSTITDFAYIFNRAGQFVYVNQALLNLWGLKLEDAVGKNFHELQYPKELADRLQRQIEQVFTTKTGLTDETPYTSPTGTSGYYEYIFQPVLDRDGDVLQVAGSTRDITERKRVEKELRQSQERFRLLAETLENQVQTRTIELEERNNEVLVHSEHLRDLSVRLMETQDQERRRIARELHDSAGQTIVALLMSLEKIAAQAKKLDPKLVELAAETRGYAKELEQEIRTTSYLLHPPLLDEIGLRAALHWYAEGLKQRAGLDVVLDVQREMEGLSGDMELTIFRVVQECLTNIHRHSGSKSAQIRIACEGHNVMVEVRDGGCGIAADRLKKIRAKGGVGLRGMRERVRQFAGEVRIESQEGVGTTIVVTLPQVAGGKTERAVANSQPV
jgi:PAS domain S-box-containing protein